MTKGMQATASKGSGQSPRGLDYTPQRPATKGISYGIAPRIKAGRRQTVHEIVDRRLSNFEAGAGPPLSREITCDNDILLSRYAPDWCRSYRGICDHFEAQALPHQVDLIGVLTLRFEDRDLRHRMWESSRAFLYQRVAMARDLPVILALHIPSIAARPSPPHLHALIFLRALPGSDWGVFADDLCGSDAKAILAKEWADWRRTEGAL